VPNDTEKKRINYIYIFSVIWINLWIAKKDGICPMLKAFQPNGLIINGSDKCSGGSGEEVKGAAIKLTAAKGAFEAGTVPNLAGQHGPFNQMDKLTACGAFPCAPVRIHVKINAKGELEVTVGFCKKWIYWP
jgi:hypothetical protein